MTHRMSVRNLIDVLGRPNLIRETGVSTQQVTNWISGGRISPRHYPAIRRLCERQGVKVPEHLMFPESTE